MNPNQAGPSSPLDINNLQDAALNLLLFLASIVSKSADSMVRPLFGSRYYQPAVDAFAFLLLIVVASMHSLAAEVTHMIPFVGGPPLPAGMFDLWWLVRISFLLQIVHRIRLFRLMINPSKEKFSWYEGPALPFMGLIPGSRSFWKTRTLIEPALVFAVASVLQHLFIFQSSLATFLQVSAVALFVKQSLHWYMSWQVMRDALDAANAAPLMNDFIEGRATDEEMAPVHLASFPKDTTPEIRRVAAIKVARAYGQTTTLGEN
jgi:hypothetical protein